MNDLKEELYELIFDREFREALNAAGSRIPDKIDDLSTLRIKGLLFQAYTVVKDYNSIYQINTQSLDYRKRIIKDPSINDITFHNSIQNSNHTFIRNTNKKRQINYI